MWNKIIEAHTSVTDFCRYWEACYTGLIQILNLSCNSPLLCVRLWGLLPLSQTPLHLSQALLAFVSMQPLSLPPHSFATSHLHASLMVFALSLSSISGNRCGEIVAWQGLAALLNSTSSSFFLSSGPAVSRAASLFPIAPYLSSCLGSPFTHNNLPCTYTPCMCRHLESTHILYLYVYRSAILHSTKWRPHWATYVKKTQQYWI